MLADLVDADVPESSQSFAERLGQWLDFKSSLALLSVLDRAVAGATEPAVSAPEGAAMREALARVRNALTKSIMTDEVFKPGKPLVELSAAPVAVDCSADFAPFHSYYLAHQRDISANVAALRASARAALSKRSPALKRLATLDAVLDQAMAAREGSLLATVPGLLAKRFEQLRKASQAADEPDQPVQSDGWLGVFHQEMRAVLLAELELRLQPVAGLIAALDNEGSISGE